MSKKKEILDDILLGTAESDLEFNKYKGEALDWTWDKITGGENGNA